MPINLFVSGGPLTGTPPPPGGPPPLPGGPPPPGDPPPPGGPPPPPDPEGPPGKCPLDIPGAYDVDAMLVLLICAGVVIVVIMLLDGSGIDSASAAMLVSSVSFDRYMTMFSGLLGGCPPGDGWFEHGQPGIP